MNQSVIEVNGVYSGDGNEEALVVLPVHDGKGIVKSGSNGRVIEKEEGVWLGRYSLMMGWSGMVQWKWVNDEIGLGYGWIPGMDRRE